MEAPAIGIDLGTTYSCVAVYHKGKVHVIPNPEQGADLTTPSYVFLETDGHEVIGEPAKSNAHRNPENTIYDVKRILGREFTDPELQNDMKFWPFTVLPGEEDEAIPMVLVNGQLLYPEEISAKLLAKLKSFAETYLQLEAGSITKAVITVPAYFHDGQRQATIDAGELAGLEVLTILNEPTAAAIAYSAEQKDRRPQKILIYDLGGGTFDVAVLKMEPGNIEVLGVNGDTHLGGEDFDKNLMEFCLAQFKSETEVDLLELKDSSDSVLVKKANRCLRRLKTQCESGKKVLTSGVKGTISVDAFYDGEDLVVNVKRQQFEDMNKTNFEKTIELVDATLKELGLSKKDIDDIVLVGGSTRIPKVQQLLKDYFPGKMLNSTIHPDQAVAQGAAIHAALMTTTGATGKFLRRFKFHKISDVTPMAVGIMDAVTEGLDAHIPKNTKLPAKLSCHCMTEDDYQTIMTFQIYQGNDLKVAENNRWLGSFELTGIPHRTGDNENIELIEVTMEINEMGILHVEAVCQSNQRSNSITIQENKNRMSQETKRRLLDKANNPSAAEGLELLEELHVSVDEDDVAEKGSRDHDIEITD